MLSADNIMVLPCLARNAIERPSPSTCGCVANTLHHCSDRVMFCFVHASYNPCKPTAWFMFNFCGWNEKGTVNRIARMRNEQEEHSCRVSLGSWKMLESTFTLMKVLLIVHRLDALGWYTLSCASRYCASCLVPVKVLLNSLVMLLEFELEGNANGKKIGTLSLEDEGLSACIIGLIGSLAVFEIDGTSKCCGEKFACRFSHWERAWTTALWSHGFQDPLMNL